MYKRFALEGDIHAALDCVPLSVRRKLDLAGLKISLEGWQALPHVDRRVLCHLPVATDEDVEIYRDIMKRLCERAGVPLRKLEDPIAEARAWNDPHVPEAVRARVRALGLNMSDDTWHAFDEETRYALLKLCDPKRNPLKIEALLVELGLRPGPAPVVEPKVVVCEPEVPVSRKT